MHKRFFSLMLMFCLLIQLITPLAGDAVADTVVTKRYTVLILDTSGSMSGEPAKVQKEAALKFCEALRSANGESYVAIVKLNTTSSLYCDFTDNQETLTSCIQNLPASGGTNISQALDVADSSLSAIDNGENIVKNIVLCSDGLPESGDRSASGVFTSSDGGDYQYANAVCARADILKEKYNLYTLGFFHSLSGNDLRFGERLMEYVQNKGYYTVTDPDDLLIVFGDITEALTQARLRELYANQHVAYYNGAFKSEVQKLILPDEDSQSSTNYILGNIVNDARENGLYKGYSFLTTLDDVVNLNFSFLDSAASNYELILADLITSKYYSEIVEEATFATTVNDVSNGVGLALSFIGDNMDEAAKAAGVTVATLKAEWAEVASALDQMSLLENPDEYGRLFGKCSVVVNKYINAEQMKKTLSKASRFAKIAGVFADATFSTASEVICFASCYDAYVEATDTLKEMLVAMYYVADTHIYSGDLGDAYYYASLAAGIENFIDHCTPDYRSVLNVVSRYAKRFTENLKDATIRAFVQDVVLLIPYVGPVLAAIPTATSGTLLLVNALTDIDDISYKASMIQHMYYFVNCAQKAAEMLGAHINTSTDHFQMARRFDEAVRIWRGGMLMLSDFSYAYEMQRLKEAIDHVQHLPGPLSTVCELATIEAMSWYSTAATISAAEKARISAIHCHDANLSYSGVNNTVDISRNARVVLIACPVTVRVKDATGNVQAILSDKVTNVAAGYQPYFHVAETEPGSGDYMKICFVPKDWHLEFTGSGTGEMFVASAEITNGQIIEQRISDRVSVQEGTEGHISFSTPENLIVIDAEPTQEISISLDQNAYVCNVGDEFVVEITIATPVPYQEGNHRYIGYFAYLNRTSYTWEQVNAWYIDGGTTQGKLRMGISNWKELGINLFTVSVFPVDNFTTGAALKDFFFYVYILKQNEDVLALPSGIKIIQAEAFANTKSQQMKLPEGIESIGEGAFSNMANLRQINLPASISAIGAGAFDNSPNVTIICPPQSFAAKWAHQNSVSVIEAGKLPTAKSKGAKAEPPIVVDLESTCISLSIDGDAPEDTQPFEWED